MIKNLHEHLCTLPFDNPELRNKHYDAKNLTRSAQQLKKELLKDLMQPSERSLDNLFKKIGTL